MSLLSSNRRAVALSPPLPVNHSLLNSVGLTFRRGQFSLLASAPRVGKSLFATNLAIYTKVPTLFLSADSDEWTVRTRACSILTNTELEKVERQLNDATWEQFYTDKLHRSDHVDWCFRSDIDTEFIWDRIKAHAELRGEYPYLLVVDNLTNTVTDTDNEYTELRGIVRELQAIARGIKAHVLALHHVKGNKEDGYQPIGLGDLLGNIGKVPEMVLGLNRNGDGSVTMTVPKNRGGKDGLALPLAVNYPTATVEGFLVNV